ncbi:MAG: aldehyde dehydrogenase family protein, partial [Nocardioides sp.]|uniref:aldehyde dehydrogenase family protein n=1 Tax=Nocardioides sp. TaxID=35761 RepID=UPI0039E3C2B8
MTLLDAKLWDRAIFLGEFTEGSGGDYAVIEPATGAELGRLGLATSEDVDRACAAAARAQRSWAAAPY